MHATISTYYSHFVLIFLLKFPHKRILKYVYKMYIAIESETHHDCKYKTRLSWYISYTMKHAHSFGVHMFCWGLIYLWIQLFLPIPIRVASLALKQRYDCPNATEETLKDMGKNQPRPILTITHQHENRI